MTEKAKRNILSKELKLLIVQRIFVLKELTVHMAAKEYNIKNEGNIYTWKKAMERDGLLHGPIAVQSATPPRSTALVSYADLQGENERLMARNQELERQLNDVLHSRVNIEDDADTLHFINMTLGRELKNVTRR